MLLVLRELEIALKVWLRMLTAVSNMLSIAGFWLESYCFKYISTSYLTYPSRSKGVEDCLY